MSLHFLAMVKGDFGALVSTLGPRPINCWNTFSRATSLASSLAADRLYSKKIALEATNRIMNSEKIWKVEKNGMLRPSLGEAVIFISLQHFILPYLTYCPACKPEVPGIAIRAVSQVGQNKVLLRTHINTLITLFYLKYGLYEKKYYCLFI